MSKPETRKKGNGGREQVTISLPPDLLGKLQAFCRERNVPPDLVVERALADYFREGDMSH